MFLLFSACTVGEVDPDLAETLATTGEWIDASEVSPANCGHQEVLTIEVSNRSDRAIDVWARFDLEQRTGEVPGEAPSISSWESPVTIEPGDSHQLRHATATYAYGPDLLVDLAGAALWVANGDPADPEPPDVSVSSRNRCEPDGAPSVSILPIGLEPGTLALMHQTLGDITPENCPSVEAAGVVVRNLSASTPVWYWLGFPFAAEEEWPVPYTAFTSPVQVAPGQEVTSVVELSLSSGVDLEEVVLLGTSDWEPGDEVPFIDVDWIDRCGT
jgi:hypothetical protein